MSSPGVGEGAPGSAPERDASRPRIRDAIRLVPIEGNGPTEGGGLAFDTERDAVHRLNATAAVILALCDGTRDRAEIEAFVASVGAGLETGVEVEAWLEEAGERGLVEFGASAAAPHRELDAAELGEWIARLRERGEIELALLAQARRCELLPDDAEAWVILGDLAHIVGDRERSCVAYRRYLELVPDDAEVQHLLHAREDRPAPPRASDAFLRRLYTRFAGFYERNMRDDLGYRVPELLAEAIEPLRPTVRGGLRTLDLGCGTGLAGRIARPWSRRLVGVDISAPMAEIAAEARIYDDLHVEELTAWLTRDDETFDLILASDVLIYFGDLVEPIELAARRLAPGGLLAFSVEMCASPAWRLTDSGRYAHSAAHLGDAARAAGLDLLSLKQAVLREEYGETVTGLVTVLRRAASGE